MATRSKRVRLNRDDPADREAIAARGDRLRQDGLAIELCWLPEPQERAVLPLLAGKPAGGKLWFDGDTKTKKPVRCSKCGELEADCMCEDSKRRWSNQDDREPRMTARDVRRGDRWLPWHFEGKG